MDYFRLWKYEPETIGRSEFLLDSSLIDTLEFDNDIFAAGELSEPHFSFKYRFELLDLSKKVYKSWINP